MSEETIEDPGVRTREEKLALWGEGPWVDEPDRVEFRHAGLPCLITRHPDLGTLCGYVAVPPSHPWHGKGNPPVRVHGGCNYANECAHRICHVPEPGEPANVWWFGFDCGHAFDLAPMWARANFAKMFGNKVIYRDFVYMEGQVRSLAEQLNLLVQVEPPAS